jgi:hypothetical protein
MAERPARQMSNYRTPTRLFPAIRQNGLSIQLSKVEVSSPMERAEAKAARRADQGWIAAVIIQLFRNQSELPRL